MDVRLYRKYIIEPNNYNYIKIPKYMYEELTEKKIGYYSIDDNNFVVGYIIEYNPLYYIYPIFNQTKHETKLNIYKKHITKKLKSFSNIRKNKIKIELNKHLLNNINKIIENYIL